MITMPLDCVGHKCCYWSADWCLLTVQTSGDEPNKLTILMADVVKVSPSAHLNPLPLPNGSCCPSACLPHPPFSCPRRLIMAPKNTEDFRVWITRYAQQIDDPCRLPTCMPAHPLNISLAQVPAYTPRQTSTALMS